MKHYKYIGCKPSLIGHTALGRMEGESFIVQVDDINHEWSHGWHLTNIENWELLSDS